MRLILLTLFAPSTADFAWESSAPAYHATAALADSEDSASCCGCERVSDPAYGEDGLSCPCDATAGACDAGCCCDTSDCTASELVDVFGCPSAGAPGGAGRAGVTYCSDLLARANIPQTAAARGWWMMRLFGHKPVSILDGGLDAWKAAGGPLEQGEPAAIAHGSFTSRPAIYRSKAID